AGATRTGVSPSSVTVLPEDVTVTWCCTTPEATTARPANSTRDAAQAVASTTQEGVRRVLTLTASAPRSWTSSPTSRQRPLEIRQEVVGALDADAQADQVRRHLELGPRHARQGHPSRLLDQ